MTLPSLTPSMVDNPAQWHLAMRAGKESLDIIAYSAAVRDSLIFRSFKFDSAATSALEELQHTVYANPMLVECEFGKITCIVGDSTAIPVPNTGYSNTELEAIYRSATGEEDFATLNLSQDVAGNALFLQHFDPATEGFLKRTFYGIKLFTPLEVLTRHFHALSRRVNGTKLHLNFSNNGIELIALDGTRLTHANRFGCTNAKDAAYYTLAVAQQLQFDFKNDTILLSGNSGFRPETSSLLQRFAAKVHPLVFPTTIFAAGRDAMSAPYDLVASCVS